MFFNAPGNPTKFKKTVYLLATIILGLLLSLLAHAFIEISYLNWVQSKGQIVQFYGSCALPPLLQTSVWILGAVGGFFLGRFWWRKVYIERIWVKGISKQ